MSLQSVSQKRMRQLQAEYKNLHQASGCAWKNFDHILEPIWLMDESMTIIHQKLVTILSKLQRLKDLPIDFIGTPARSSEIIKIQEELHEFERTYPTKDAKITLKSGEISKGQAIISALLNKCYKLVHRLLEMEPDMDESLLPIYDRVKNLRLKLESLSTDLSLGIDIQTEALKILQEEVDAIDSLKSDGTFKVDGKIPEGYLKLILKASSTP